MLSIKIVTPEGQIYQSDEIISATLPTETGVITVLEGHVDLITLLYPGEIEVTKPDHVVEMAISEGIVFVKNGTEILLMADTAERAEDINIEKAEEAHRRVEAFMQEKERITDVDFARLQAKIEKEMARVRVGKKYKNIQ